MNTLYVRVSTDKGDVFLIPFKTPNRDQAIRTIMNRDYPDARITKMDIST